MTVTGSQGASPDLAGGGRACVSPSVRRFGRAMTSLLVLALAHAGCGGGCGQGTTTTPGAPQADSGVREEAETLVGAEVAADDVASAPDGDAVDLVAEAASFVIRADPPELMVYRSTPVTLRVEAADGSPLPAGASCRWRPGDGTPEIAVGSRDGCALDHVFLGGSADQRVAVTVVLAGREVEATRIVPLERLKVTGTSAPTDAMPAAPTGPTSFRVVFVAETRGLSGERLRALTAAVLGLEPALVVHMGGLVDEALGSERWSEVREVLAEPLRARGVPLLVAASPGDLAAGGEIRRPIAGDAPLELIDGEAFPSRYALSFRGVFIAVVSGADQEQGGLAWLRSRLAEAQVYESRLVLSHLPLHPFAMGAGRSEAELIGPKFKVYELLHRGRVTALVSAGEAFFKGRYGALSVLSVGSSVTPGTLLGDTYRQPPSIAVLDVQDGAPVRVFGVVGDEGAPFSTLFDETRLPEAVEVYTR